VKMPSFAASKLEAYRAGPRQGNVAGGWTTAIYNADLYTHTVMLEQKRPR